MKLMAINGLSYILLGFFFDYILLGITRRLKLPDFLAHLFTGFALGAVYSWFSLQIPFSAAYGMVPPPLLKFLFQVGIFCFFFLFAIHYDFRLLRILREEKTWVSPLLFSGIILGLLFPIGWFFFRFSFRDPAFYLLPLTLLAADLASLITGGFFTHEQIRTRFGHRIFLSLALESAALAGMVAVALVFRVTYSLPPATELFYLGGAFLLFLFLLSKRLAPFRSNWLTSFPLSFPILAIAIVLIDFFLYVHLPLALGGLFLGLLVGEILRTNQVKFWGTIFKPFRFLVIFPLWGIGTLCSNPLPDQWNYLGTGSILFFITFLISAFGVGLLWLKEKKEFLVPSLSLLNRAEFSLLLLMEGYLLHWISRDILLMVGLVSVLWILIARTGLIKKLDDFLSQG